jgi:hypothetical protein
MPSQAQIDANRKNAQRSTGPRTPEGKSRVRFNALKDGVTAKSPVIPGEDPAEFQARIDTWTKDLAPSNSVESFLVEHAVRTSWQLDRIDRAHAARLRANIRNTTTDKAHHIQQRVIDLGRRLFHDPRGPITSYPHFEYKPHMIPGQPRISWTGLVDDPNHPAALLHELESTHQGCQWLLARWTDLRCRLDLGLAWQPPDKLKAIRLLGHQPLDALDNAEIATIFHACHALDPTYDDPFHELWKELSAGEKIMCESRLDTRGYESLQFDQDDPEDRARARDWLRNRATRAIKRLQRLLANHHNRAELDAADEADRLAFDDSPGGERLRRFHANCSRSLFQSLDQLRKSKQPSPAPTDSKIHAPAKPLSPFTKGEPEGVFPGNNARTNAPPASAKPVAPLTKVEPEPVLPSDNAHAKSLQPPETSPTTATPPQKNKPNPQPPAPAPTSISAHPDTPTPVPVTVPSTPQVEIPKNGCRETRRCSLSPGSRAAARKRGRSQAIEKCQNPLAHPVPPK